MADGPGGVALQPLSPYGITDWQAHVHSDSALHRPADRAVMVGDAGKAAAILDWRPTTRFPDIVGAMVVSDLRQEQSP
ncbi:hypothetical protein [Mycobacterium sp. MMS18-G62]